MKPARLVVTSAHTTRERGVPAAAPVGFPVPAPAGTTGPPAGSGPGSGAPAAKESGVDMVPLQVDSVQVIQTMISN
ncbi:hypothetical protein Sm713_05160 [Streptomyces sp. TS71-3]|nr:hypothetical protein Sm713_05160 [Streptomyces sp. TS71-3]